MPRRKNVLQHLHEASRAKSEPLSVGHAATTSMQEKHIHLFINFAGHTAIGSITMHISKCLQNCNVLKHAKQ